MFPYIYAAARVADHLLPKLGVAKPNYAVMTRNPELAAQFRNDPLVHHGPLLLHFSTEILRAMKRIQRQAPTLDLPLFVLQGTSDWVVTPSGAVDLVEAASSSDKTLKLYEGCYHALLHEPERERILGDLVRWIEEHESPACFSSKNR